MLPEHCETREKEAKKGPEGSGRQRASRIGAFENVISIIARWFYEAVQARNAWRLAASLYVVAVLFFSSSANPLRLYLCFSVHFSLSLSFSATLSLSLSLAVYILIFRLYGFFSRGKCLSLSVHFNLLKARKATPVLKREICELQTWPLECICSKFRGKRLHGETITNRGHHFLNNIRVPNTILNIWKFLFFYTFRCNMKFNCQIW